MPCVRAPQGMSWENTEGGVRNPPATVHVLGVG